jgi:hypothetical protein
MASSGYRVELISIDEKHALFEKYKGRILYEEKADIYGCCIKLLTDLKSIKERWEENFFSMSANIRSHGRLLVTKEEGEGLRVLYDPLSKTAFLLNVGYYGWVKSIALSVAGDVLEDEHEIFSIHGACLDMGGKGFCLMGAGGAGKTTNAYGLLRLTDMRVVSDDWFFVRLYGGDALAFGSEKNFYIRADLATVWEEFKWVVDKAEFDQDGRAIIDIRWIIGKGRIVPLTTLKMVFFLKRDPEDKTICRELEAKEAVDYLEANGYFNPHLLVRNEQKAKLRRNFFQELFKRTSVHVVNTIQPPHRTQELLKNMLTKT